MKAKVFLGWSGETSKVIALELHEWLRSVIQLLDPWMSKEDLTKGARWTPELAKALAESKAGIFCLAPDNLKEPWLNFEAGAISNTDPPAYVCTYLVGVTSSSVKGPLAQFQWTDATSKHDNLQLLEAINTTLGEDALDQKILEKAFELRWPELEQKLRATLTVNPTETPRREVADMVEETLNRVRDLQKQSAEPPKLQPVYYTVDSSPSAPTAYGQLVALGGPAGVGAQGAGVFTLGGSSDDPPGYIRVGSGKLYGGGPQGPTSTIRPQKSNNPKEK
jgi:hypothetical protein